ncbi:hypothetical protein Taro_048644 [Colocasia esculenta]|uniref:GOLD domain-containing protein n=1 Tax=Colocasia esculenta TaxID=4460 RepID=A0A843X8P2_COLES|nr:hypothetical protein [Colocasia esculenta]
MKSSVVRVNLPNGDMVGHTGDIKATIVTCKAADEAVKVMELELKKLEDTVKSIHEEMFYLRSREEEMRTTNSRMAWLSFLSLAVCLSVAGLQLWHLKTFFERKKLL